MRRSSSREQGLVGADSVGESVCVGMRTCMCVCVEGGGLCEDVLLLRSGVCSSLFS